MPFDVGFTRVALSSAQRVAVARDGKHVAFTVHEHPARSTAGVRVLPNGVPGSIPDSRIFVNDIATGKSTRIAPEGGNCWRPSFSPDGRSLAFYCDAGGSPRLWVFDIGTSAARKLADTPVKPKVWTGDEPDWGPDGKEIFVPLAPASSLHPSGAPAIAGMDEPGMEVSKGGWSLRHRSPSRSGAARGERPEAGRRGGAQAEGSALQMRWNNAAVAAVELATGRVRVLAAEDSNPPPSVLQVSPSGKWVAYLSVFRQPAIDPIPRGPGSRRRLRARRRGCPSGSWRRGFRFRATTFSAPTPGIRRRDQLFWVKDGQLWTSDLAADAASPRRLGETLGEITPGLMAVTRNGKSIVVGSPAVRPSDL